MPLERRIIDVPLSAGLGQQVDARSLEQTGAAAMTNCVRQKGGAITKRYGSYALPNTIPQLSGFTTPVRAVRGQAFAGAALLLDGNAIYQFSDGANSFELADVTPEAVALDRITVAGNISALSGYDVATAPGQPVCITWVGTSGAGGTLIYTTVLDAVSGEVLQPPTIVDASGSAAFPRVILCGTTFVLAWKYSTFLMLSSLSATNIAAGWHAPVTYSGIFTVGGQGNYFDLANVAGDAMRFLLAYSKNGGAGGNVFLDIASVGSLANLNSFQTSTAETDIQFLTFACAGSSGSELWAAYLTKKASGGGSDIHLRAFGVADVGHAVTNLMTLDTLTQYVGGQLAIVTTSATAAMVALSYSAATPAPAYTAGGTGGQTIAQRYFMQTSTYSVNASSSSAKVGTLGGLVLASKFAPIMPNLATNTYALAYVPSPLQGTCVLLSFDLITNNPNPGRIVSVVAPRLTKSVMGLYNSGPTIDQVGSWVLPQLVQLPAMATRNGGSASTWGTVLEIDTSPTNASLALQPWDFGSQLLYFGETVGPELAMSAGASFSFDGSYTSELGYLYYPEVIAGTSSNTGGNMIVGATYTYIPVYEWIDSLAGITRGAAGLPFTAPAVPYQGTTASITGGAAQSATISGLAGMTAGMVNTMSLVLNGATTAGGNAVFEITGFTNATTVSVANTVYANGVSDANNGHISWQVIQGSGSPTGCAITVHADGTVHVTGLTGMVAAYVGQAITFGSPAFTPGEPSQSVNQGTFPITQVISPTEVVINNPAAITDGNNSGNMQWYLPHVGTGSVALTLPPLGVTYRQRSTAANSGTYVNSTFITPPNLPPVQIVLYRNTGSYSGTTWVQGTTFYRCTNATAPQAPAPNQIGVGTVTWTDALSDAQIVTNPILYTQGGLLDNFIPPSARVCVQHTSRWFLAGCDDPTVIWASKAFVPGEIPGFNEQLTIQCSGAVRALASLDDKLVIFVQRGSVYGIEYVTGLGPLDTGAQNDWTTPPLRIPSDVGAVDQRSIVVGPFGCVFKSNVGGPQGTGGIFLLSRDMQVTYLSGPVEDVLASYPVITSAALHPNAGRVYFTCAASDALVGGSLGARLVWDYLRGCWSQDILYDFDASAGGIAARCAWVASGVQAVPGAGATYPPAPLYHWASPTGRVYRETTGQGGFAYVDSSAAGARQWITKSFTSAWIKPSMSGFSRFWRIQAQATASDPAQVTMVLAFDYASSSYYSESATWNDSQIASFDRFPNVDVQMVPGNQKAKAIQVTLGDLAPIGTYSTGRGADWATLSFELGVGGRAYPNLPSGQKA